MSRIVKFINGNMMEYEILKLVSPYDSILKTPTKKVIFPSSENKQSISSTGELLSQADISFHALSLMETLSKLKGLGLSANQVGLPYSIFALNTGDQIWCLINPVLLWQSEELSEYREGCLSYPGLFLKIRRPKSIKVQFNAIGGELLEQQFDGLTATCVMHEMDHLNGIVFTDLVSPITLDIERRKVKKNLRKIKRISAAS